MGIYTDILEAVTRKPGDVWKTKTGGFRGMNRSGNMQTFSDPDKAKSYVATKDKEEDEPKGDKSRSKKEPKKQSSKNIPGGSPAIVPFSGTDPESVEGINKDQQSRESQRDIGKAGAGGKKASQGEARYCNALNTLDNDKFKEENTSAISEKKKTLEPNADDIKDLQALGLDSDSEEGREYLATREVYADKELERIKKIKGNVFDLPAGFGGNEKDYKDWMKAAYDGTLATRKVLKEDTAMDTSKPMTAIQSEGPIDDKVQNDLESKISTAKTDEDRTYYENELKQFKKFREYHDTYMVGVDKNGRTHIVSVSNKKSSNLRDPQNNTTPAKRFDVIKESYGSEVAKTVTDSLDSSIKRVRETKQNAARSGSDVPIDKDVIKEISNLGSKYTKDLDTPKGDFGEYLKKEGIKYPEGKWPKGAEEKLKIRNEYTKKMDGNVSYNSFGRLWTKLGESKAAKDAPRGSSLAQCRDIKIEEKDAVSKAHRQVIDDIHKADGGAPKPGQDNGKHAQGYVNTVMDAMHFNSYIDGGDGKMIIQMGIRGAQPSQIRGCLGELSGYKGDVEGPDGREKLKDHLRKRCRIDEKNGNILIQDEGKTTTLAEDTWRTAGAQQKVASGFGTEMRDCISGKVDNKRQERETSEQKVYESMASAVRRVTRANL